MLKKLIEALTTKFGVTAKVVEGIAEKLSKTISSEEEIETVVNGVTFQQVLESYADKRANEASETARKNAIKGYEDKYGLKDGVKVEDPAKKAEEEAKKKAEEEAKAAAEAAAKAAAAHKSEEEGNKIPEYIQKLLDSQKQAEEARIAREEKLMKTIESLQGEVTGLKTAKTLESRKSILDKEIETLTDAQKRPYTRVSLDSMSEDEFTTFIEETKADVATIAKDAAAAAAASSRPMFGNVGGNGKKASDDELKAVMDKI